MNNKKQPLNKSVIIFWWPGAWKTTLVENILGKFKIPTIEIGNINRSIMTSEINKELKRQLQWEYDKKWDRDPQVILNGVRFHIKMELGNTLDNWFIVDGLKNINEVFEFMKLIKDYWIQKLDLIVILKSNKKESLKRLRNRPGRNYKQYKPIFDYRLERIKDLFSEIKSVEKVLAHKTLRINTSNKSEFEVFEVFEESLSK